MRLSVILAGGGTGGHLFPGLAVARALLSRVPGTAVTFVGTKAGIEARVIPREQLPIAFIRSAGLKGKSLSTLARGLLLLPLSAWDSWRVLTRFAPSVVVGLGGYSSGPVVLLAAVRGVPTLLLEQNATPGLTNRVLARVVTAAAVTYAESAHVFGDRAEVTGNPVRPEFFTVGDVDARSSAVVRVLIFGGSQGAHAINEAMVSAAVTIASANVSLEITHQTGERDLGIVKEAYARARLTARVEPFLNEMPREMARADIVVCRAGATTLAELCAVGRAAIVVPLPSATDDHQRKNAMALATRGAALMIEQSELTGVRLARELVGLATDPERRSSMAAAARTLARPDAANKIVDRIVALAG